MTFLLSNRRQQIQKRKKSVKKIHLWQRSKKPRPDFLLPGGFIHFLLAKNVPFFSFSGWILSTFDLYRTEHQLICVKKLRCVSEIFALGIFVSDYPVAPAKFAFPGLVMRLIKSGPTADGDTNLFTASPTIQKKYYPLSKLITYDINIIFFLVCQTPCVSIKHMITQLKSLK